MLFRSWNGTTSNSSQLFEICIAGPSYPTGDCKNITAGEAAAGSVLSWTDLEPGSYNVTETDTGSEWSVDIKGSPASVVSFQTASANVTNTLCLGALKVTKIVDWNGTTANATKEFEVCITGPSYPTGNCTMLKDGETALWTGLTPGSYNVTEKDAGSQWSVDIKGSPALVASICNCTGNGRVIAIEKVTEDGIENANVYEINMSNGSVVSLGTVSDGIDPTQGKNNYPNGFAFDYAEGRLYYAVPNNWSGNTPVSDSDATVYFFDVNTGNTTNAGTVEGVPTDASYYDNSYYYIPQETDDLHKVTLNTDGTLNTETTIANISGTLNRSFSFGDIAITDLGFVYGSARESSINPSYIFFTFSLSNPSGTYTEPGSYSVQRPQLALGGNGELFACDTADGQFYSVDKTNGSLTEIFESHLFNDLASGFLCETSSVNVTNTYGLGALNVTKIVDWNGVTSNSSQLFEICIEGPSYPTGDCKNITAGETAAGTVLSWTDLEPGSYNVTEKDTGSEWSVDIKGSPASVVSFQTASANVTNTYGLGALNVTKIVDWNGTTSNSSQLFEICIAGPSYPTGDCKNITAGEAAAGTVLSWTDLEPGSYNVTETDTGSEWSVDIKGSPARVASFETASANVTNTYGLGALNVTKIVDWNGTTANATKEFEVCITGPSYPAGNCTMIKDGETASWTDLIPGSYNVTETDAGSEWSVDIKGSPAQVISFETASANVTNTYDFCEGEITIYKVDGQGCTPGYWKTHPGSWPTEYSISDEIGSVFDVPPCVGELATDSLIKALYYGGGDGVVGAAQNLLRAAVASVLNSVSPKVDFPHTEATIIALVNNALASCDRDTMLSLAESLDNDNNLGCPLPCDECHGYLGGASFRIAPDPTTGSGSLIIEDNDSNDADTSDGIIVLRNVPCGDYIITEHEAPEGYIKAEGSQNVTVTHESSEEITFINTEECTGCLEICKYEDMNGNGERDWYSIPYWPYSKEEPLLSGWTFIITGPDGYSETVTTGSGFASSDFGCDECDDDCITLCDLMPGSYNITEVPQDGWTNTDPSDGSGQKTVDVICDDTVTVLFGNHEEQECTGCLEICKYNDLDGDGSKDWDEPYLSGWTFTVTGPDGYSETVTTGSGFTIASSDFSCDECDDDCIILCDLMPGSYNITEIPQEGWTNTDPGDGSLKKIVQVTCDDTITVKFGNHRITTSNPSIDIDKTVDFNGDGEYHDCETPWWGECRLDGLDGFNIPAVISINSTNLGDFEALSREGNMDSIPTAISINSTNSEDFGKPIKYYANWKIVVTNTGDCTLYDILITDSNGKDWTINELGAGESETYTYRTRIKRTTINCAEGYGEDIAGNEVFDEDCAEARLW